MLTLASADIVTAVYSLPFSFLPAKESGFV